MTSTPFVIREILPTDNKQMATIIRNVILEMGAPKIGTAYEDEATDCMFETYQKEKAGYFVIEKDNQILGGCGYAKLNHSKNNTCELQKMYFLPEARGKGLGSKMITKCLTKASKHGFEYCYLETMPYMKAAQKLYKKNGFYLLDSAQGSTGHYSCNVWMLKKL